MSNTLSLMFLTCLCRGCKVYQPGPAETVCLSAAGPKRCSRWLRWHLWECHSVLWPLPQDPGVKTQRDRGVCKWAKSWHQRREKKERKKNLNVWWCRRVCKIQVECRLRRTKQFAWQVHVDIWGGKIENNVLLLNLWFSRVCQSETKRRLTLYVEVLSFVHQSHHLFGFGGRSLESAETSHRTLGLLGGRVGQQVVKVLREVVILCREGPREQNKAMKEGGMRRRTEMWRGKGGKMNTQKEII